MDDESKGTKRGKPQQQLYRPGGGLYKKSQEDGDNGKVEYQKPGTEPSRKGHGRSRGRGYAHKDTNRQTEDLLDKMNTMNISQDDERKKSFKSRKPEQQIYVPKSRTVSEREENNSSPALSDNRVSDSGSRAVNKFNGPNSLSDRLNSGFGDSHNNLDARTRRHSGGQRRNHHDNLESTRKETDNPRFVNDNRQNSEPRNLSPPRKNQENHVQHRNRDTRSMETSAPRHMHHSNGAKPPSGPNARRNSTVVSGSESKPQSWYGSNIESMPPRFRKKLLADQHANEVTQATWDGSSLVFQGNSNYHTSQPPVSWSQTLPSRGRNRHVEDEIEKDRLKPLNNLTQSFESGSDSRSSTPHGSTSLPINVNKPPPNLAQSQENILIEKLTGQTMPPPSKFPSKVNDHMKYPKNSKISYDVHDNNLQMDKSNGLSGSTNIKSGDSWASDQMNDHPAKLKENISNLKPPIKNAISEKNSSSGEKPSNKLLESITSCDKAASVVDQSSNITDWAMEIERSSSLENNKEMTLPKRIGLNDHPVDSKLERHQDNRQGRGPGGRQGGGGGGSERKPGEGRKKKKRIPGVKKKSAGNRRSSSRCSQKRERSIDNVRNRSDRSPHSQGHNRDLRDHYRDKDNKENVGHRDVRDFPEKDKSRDDRGYYRGDRHEISRLPGSHKNPYSRENSKERRCFSRNNSIERGGLGSRPGSRDRSHHYGPDKPVPPRNEPTAPKVFIDPEKIILPPPPPPIMRSSRNQSRRDSWSARGSRHASIESGHDLAYSPPRGGGGKGSRRKQKDSDHRHLSSTTNWRDEMPIVPDRAENDLRRKLDPISGISERRHDNKGLAPGIIVLPQDNSDKNRSKNPGSQGRGSQNNMPGISTQGRDQGAVGSRTLYDWRNPSKPIVVPQSATHSNRLQENVPHQSTESHSGSSGRPSFYDTTSESFKSAHNQDLIREIEYADVQLQCIFRNGTIIKDWEKIKSTRPFLQRSLQRLLVSDLKFCHNEQIEHHFWKLLYYNIIENLRKTMPQDEASKAQHVEFINNIIKDGNVYYEYLLELLQNTYKFQLDEYLNAHYVSPPKGLGYVGLALISAQKIYIFLGDLARYKELVNDTSNYAKSKNWYTKANQINPKNGRPYNQLAILAVYGRRKLDAVYFYMRSLMSSNPFFSARESLIGLFDENRKKYETNERKRLAERQKAVEVVGGSRGLRREVWTRAGGGRTTTLLQADKLAACAALSDDEELTSMSSVELNKRFITTYLHVHGKLITKIGMETLSESATMMLRQFRALLRHSPLPINCGRLLQLTALNMFAIESAQLKEPTSAIVGGGCRSEVQERALSVSLRMFGALLSRCCALLSAPQENPKPRLAVHDDVIVILPAIKVWCEWMLSHSSVWNPPPPCDDFDVGGDSDPWPKLAKLMNLLEPLDLNRSLLTSEPTNESEYEVVRLPEDTQLAGFTPLMICEPETVYAPRTLDPESAKLAVRTRRLLFFGTEYLCGLDPPALERRLAAPDRAEYVSVVRRRQPIYERDASRDRHDSDGDSDIMEASMSEEEDSAIDPVDTKLDWAAEVPNDEMTKKLLRRRGQLEHRRRDLERKRLRMQALLRQGQVSVELEVRPRYLVPDTNCFIDHLPRLQRLIAPEADTPYTLVVPLVVVSELEGLTRAARVGDAAKSALEVLKIKRPTLKFATTKGNLLAMATFTAEQDNVTTMTNDDRILAASLSLCKPAAATAENEEQQTAASNGSASGGEVDPSGVKRLVREVVLLTDDRNLRVKALARDLPVRDLPAFMRWAAIE